MRSHSCASSNVDSTHPSTRWRRTSFCELSVRHKIIFRPTRRKMEMTIFHTGGVFSYLPHHLDLALEDSVGHSTCMSVLGRRRIIAEMAVFHTGGVFSYLPHHLDLALEDSVGHSTCMSVCVGASQGYHEVVGGLGSGLGLAVEWLVGSWAMG